MAATIALHIIAVIALLQYEPVRSTLSQAAPIFVRLITPVVEKPQQPPKPLRVKPRVKPVEPLPLITAITEAPAPLAPTPPPPQIAPAEPIAPAPPAPKAITAAPIPVVPPSFNADYLDNPPPPYPAVSRRFGEQGRVVLRVLVNPKGTADKVELRTSSGSSRLDDAALEVVRHWRFVPARQGDQPVAAWVLIPITFTLKG